MSYVKTERNFMLKQKKKIKDPTNVFSQEHINASKGNTFVW